jgi:hypothetical protein
MTAETNPQLACSLVQEIGFHSDETPPSQFIVYLFIMIPFSLLTRSPPSLSSSLFFSVSSMSCDNRKPLINSIVFRYTLNSKVGRDSSLGIATRYELDGPGIESQWGRDFQHTSRPALGPTQPPVQWLPGQSLG